MEYRAFRKLYDLMTPAQREELRAIARLHRISEWQAVMGGILPAGFVVPGSKPPKAKRVVKRAKKAKGSEGVNDRPSPGSSSDAAGAATRLAPAPSDSALALDPGYCDEATDSGHSSSHGLG